MPFRIDWAGGPPVAVDIPREARRQPGPTEGFTLDDIKRRAKDYLYTHTAGEGDTATSLTLAGHIWPKDESEDNPAYQQRIDARAKDLEQYGLGKRGVGAGALSALVKRSKQGDPLKPTRWFLSSRDRKRMDTERAIFADQSALVGADQEMPF